MTRRADLLNWPPFPTEGYEKLAGRIGQLLSTHNDVLIMRGETKLALEASASSIARPGLSALNIVTSAYGAIFGTWLERSGAEVTTLTAPPGRPIDVNAVHEAWVGKSHFDLVSLVHAESSSGILNPLDAIARYAKSRGALLLVDAVASIGGHALDVDDLGIDIAIVGAQKALGGSSGLSALSVSPAAWDAILRADAPRGSILSLIDLKSRWLDNGRVSPLAQSSTIEAWVLDAALSQIEAEGLEKVIARHKQAALASQRALYALGLKPWAEGPQASALITAVQLPEGLSSTQILHAGESPLSRGCGAIAERLIRLNHTGSRASQASVLRNISSLGKAMQTLGYKADTATALDTVVAEYA